jgi:hypothetical protein
MLIYRTLALAIALLLLVLPESYARFFFAGGFVPITIEAINLSGTTYSNGSPSGTVVGTISTVMSYGPPFSGTYGLQNGGVDSSGDPCDANNSTNFQIVGSVLELNTTLSGTYNVCIVATQGALSLVEQFIVTGTTSSLTISSVSVGGSLTYPNGSVAGTIIGPISVIVSMGSFTGTLSLQNGGVDNFSTPCDGASTTHFQIVGSNLELNTTLSGTFVPCIVATQSSATNSPFVQAITVTGVSVTQTISSVGLSGGTFAGGSTSGTSVGTVNVVMSPASPSFVGSLAIINTGNDTFGTPCSSSDLTNFALSGNVLTLATTLAAGTYPGVCIKATQVSSTITQAFTVVGTSSGVVLSKTLKNVASSATPTIAGTTMVPAHFGIAFAPTVIPAGNVLVASVSGSTLTNSQVDSQQCSFWADGSLRLCPWSGFVPALAAGAEEQVEFTSASGSFPTSSSIIPASIASASDFKVALSSVNSTAIAQFASHTLIDWGIYAGFYISGGSVTSGFIRNPPNGAGFVGSYNCVTAGYNCITPANFQTSTNATTLAGSKILTFGSSQAPHNSTVGITAGIGIIDTTNPSAIADNTTVTVNSAGTTVTMSNAALQNIPSTDVLQYGYVLLGCTSDPLFTVNLTSNIATSTNIIKAGSGCSAVGSGGMTFAIDTVLNAYGSTDAPLCSAGTPAAAFTESYAAGSIAVSGVSGVVAVGQLVNDGTNLAVITGGSGTSWTVNHTLAAGPIAATATPSLCIYTSGPTMKGYEGFGPYLDNVSGAPDSWERARFTIEAWTGPTGLYAIKPVIITDATLWKNKQGWPNYTFDADALNGSTEVIGAAQGGAGNVWTRLTQQTYGSWATLDPCAACATGASGRPVWLPASVGYSTANSQTLNSVILAPTAADAVFVHGDHSLLPIDNRIIPSPLVVNSTGTGGGFGGIHYNNLYAPYEHGGMDGSVSFDSGGATHILPPTSYYTMSWFLAAPIAADRGAGYLQNMRVAADVQAGVMVGPRYDDTQLPLNMFTSTAWPTPPAAFASDASIWNASFPPASLVGSYAEAMFTAGPNAAFENNPFETDHYPQFYYGEYVAEAERYVLQQWIDNAAGIQFQPTAQVSMTFGGTRYDSQIASDVSHRADAWSIAMVGPLAYLGPPNEPAIQYFSHLIASNYAEAAALYPFVGSGVVNVQSNSSTLAFTKNYDYKANGENLTVGDMRSNALTIAQAEFMDYYWAQSNSAIAMLDNGHDTNVTTVMDNYLDNYTVNNPAENCLYNMNAYVIQYGEDTPTRTPQPGWNATSVASPQRGNGYVFINNSIHSQAGSNIITSSMGTGTGILTTATATASVGATTLTLSSVSTIKSGMVLRDNTNVVAIPYPTYITAAPSGNTITLSQAVASPGVSLGDVIQVSTLWAWDYPVGSGTRIISGTRIVPANVNFNNQQSPNNVNPVSPWPPGASPTLADGRFDYFCADPSGAAIGQWSTTPCGSPTPVTFSITGDWNAAWVANASCPPVSAGDWRIGAGADEMWSPARWRRALRAYLGQSTTEADTAIANMTAAFGSPSHWSTEPDFGGDDHF